MSQLPVYDSTLAALNRHRQAGVRIGVLAAIVGFVALNLLVAGTSLERIRGYASIERRFNTLSRTFADLPHAAVLRHELSHTFFNYPVRAQDLYTKVEAKDLFAPFCDDPTRTLLDIEVTIRLEHSIVAASDVWHTIDEELLRPLSQSSDYGGMRLGAFLQLATGDGGDQSALARQLSHVLDQYVPESLTEMLSDQPVSEAIAHLRSRIEGLRQQYAEFIGLLLDGEHVTAEQWLAAVGNQERLPSRRRTSYYPANSADVPLAILSEPARAWAGSYRALLLDAFEHEPDELREYEVRGATITAALDRARTRLADQRRALVKDLLELNIQGISLPFASSVVFSVLPLMLIAVACLCSGFFNKMVFCKRELRKIEHAFQSTGAVSRPSVESRDMELLTRLAVYLGLGACVAGIQAYRLVLARYGILEIPVWQVCVEVSAGAAMLWSAAVLNRAWRRSIEQNLDVPSKIPATLGPPSNDDRQRLAKPTRRRARTRPK